MAIIPKQLFKEGDEDEFLPEGDYLAEIVKSENKATKAGDGEYLSLQFKVLEGKHKDEIVYTNLNLVNPNDVAVKIAKKTLAKICKAVNVDVLNLENSEQLHGKPMIITVTLRPTDDAYPGNEIKGFKAASGTGAPPKKNPFAKKIK